MRPNPALFNVCNHTDILLLDNDGMMIYTVIIVMVVSLCAATAAHQIYSQSVDAQNLSSSENFVAATPSIFFRSPKSPLLHQDYVKIEYGIKNIPGLLINEGRIRIGLWGCSYAFESCSTDEHFAPIYSTRSKPTNETTNLVVGSFRYSPFNLSITAEGRYRLRLVMEIIDPSSATEARPTSAIRQFVDEVTVFKKKFEMPTVDFWWNDNASINDVGRLYFTVVCLLLLLVWCTNSCF